MQLNSSNVMPSPPLWTYSPVPAVESAVQDIRRRYPATYPAGLERVHSFLEKLGHPQHRLPFVFHVAGTNGKGSTLAFLQAVFEAGGLSVHKFISPHLVRFEERIILNGRMIAPEVLLSLIHECDAAAGGEGVSFFEFFTGLAFVAYSRAPAAALLLETGLGGLYDATNVIGGDKIVSLLTTISYDHMHILGRTLPEIARNKAGIIKHGCPAVVAPQAAEVTEVFHRQADAVQAPLSLYGRDWEIIPAPGRFEYKSAGHSFTLPRPRLQGEHQLYNAGVAMAALEKSPYAFLLEQKILEQAMESVVWAGRLQHLTIGPLAAVLPPGWELWLDGAHNDSGAEILLQQLKHWQDGKPLHLVTAMKKTKDSAGFYRRLLAHVASIQAVDVSWIEAPMMSAEKLCDQIRGMGYTPVQPVKNLESALRALVFQFKTPQRILITGSLYLVGHALKE